jgi:hypothetical protein
VTAARKRGIDHHEGSKFTKEKELATTYRMALGAIFEASPTSSIVLFVAFVVKNLF